MPEQLRPLSIRPIAIFAALHEGRVLTYEGLDRASGLRFFRPPGGGIDPGESSLQALAREVKEELGFTVLEPRLLQVFESRFEYSGQARHEIVFAYTGRFAEPAAYAKNHWEGAESDGSILRLHWLPLTEVAQGRARLYPDGLFEALHA